MVKKMKNNSLEREIIVAINNILSRNKGKKYASLSEIYKEILSHRKSKNNDDLKLKIEKSLQEHSSQYETFSGKKDLFETKNIDSNLWKNRISGEKELKNLVFKLIGLFPGITITDLQKNLLEIIKEDLTEADKLESLTRPGEMKIEQIIRNFVSHKDSYKNEIDFITDKNGIIRLYLKENNLEVSKDEITAEIIIENENEKPDVVDDNLVLDTNIPRKRKTSKIAKPYIRKNDKISNLKEYEKKLDNGYLAECLVYEHEQNKLIDAGREDLAKQVKWISRDDGDGFGYDIKSYEIDTSGKVKTIYIEVKSTSSSLSADFEMSSREYKFAKEHMRKKDYKLYRVSKRNNKNVGYIIESFEEKFDVNPSSYTVSIKVEENNKES